MIRPEVLAFLRRWREALSAAAAFTFGLWLASLGGWLLVPFGVVLAALSLGWTVIALRRLRFLRGVAAPGVVEVDEGQVGYYGPSFGGFVALADLAELRLTERHGSRQWRLKTRNGEVLLVPVDAAGAEKLYDAFAALPGIDMAALAAALDNCVGTLPLWRRHDQSLAIE
ncbi:hypothetical protein DEA8626_02466 [Defluviimonas aquaemixtae]|uniref:Uncharacterized protein n=1 Tax=Albidovulum aquaemixtae TaxID=1542388 RepID=A0A2R8BJ62_9RHOB|nr:hypothetical protein [Defluviimonas aquaemixtae]SPH23402.1 hypothetical protein DEA8626_02466 [Defluviimonas aquaemixtae]